MTIDIFRDTDYGGRVDPAERKRRDAQIANETRLDVKHELQKQDLEAYPNMIHNPAGPWVHGQHKDHDNKWPGTYHVSVNNGKPMVELRFYKDQRESPTATKAIGLLKKKFDVSIVDTAPKSEW